VFKDYFVRVNTALLEEEADFFLQSGFNPELYLTGRDLMVLNNRERKKLQSRLERFDRHTLHAPFFDISPGGFDDQIRSLSYRKLKAVMELADRFGTELVVVHMNYDPVYYQESYRRWLERAARFFSDLIRESSVSRIALENIAEPTPEVSLQLIAAVDHPRMIHCFDVGHFHVFGSISLSDWFSRVGPVDRIHFHFHDNRGKSDQHLPVGEGSIPWVELRDRIRQSFRHFTITLECHNKPDLIRSIANYREIFLGSS